MVQGYYTLDEAARILKMSPEKLSNMAQKREVRAFADRGTWRFRTQDVEEMARRMGQASDEVPSLSAATPAGGKMTQLADSNAPFDFELSSDSAEVLDVPAKGSGHDASPKPSSDADVKIVTDSDQDLQLPDESGLQMAGSAVTASPNRPATPKPDSDAEPQLVPFEDDSSPLMRSPSDSDVRLEPDKKPSSAELPATEEHRLDLDTDLAKAEKSAKSSTLRAKKPKAKSPPTPPSPFELSDSDLELGKGGSGSSSPAGDSDVISIGEVSRHGDLVDATNSSGVNLHAPADSGINLEKEKDANPSSSSEIEFELSLEGDSTPDPASGSPQQGSSSSVADLDLESSSSSSEFELTLDDSGGLAPLEEDKESPSASGEKDIFETDLEVPALDEESASEVVPLDDADTDLESSDFDFDPVESESGSQVVAVDEDIDDAAATVQRKGKSKGRAAALAAGAAAGAAAAAAGEEELDEVDAMLASGEEAAVEDESESVLGRTTAPIAPAAPANWGWVPAAVLIPCVIVMFVLTLMTFELLHSMWGYRQPSGASGVLIRPISSMFGAELPPE